MPRQPRLDAGWDSAPRDHPLETNKRPTFIQFLVKLRYSFNLPKAGFGRALEPLRRGKGW
jgi:hypothetical protein